MTRLVLDPHRVTLMAPDAPALTLAIGIDDLALAILQHEPPTPAEMERAIDAVEDALMAARLPSAERGELLTSDAQLRALPGVGEEGACLSREAVEALFQRLASASLGHGAALGDLPAGAASAAALLILRECMHHLGYQAVRIGMA